MHVEAAQIRENSAIVGQIRLLQQHLAHSMLRLVYCPNQGMDTSSLTRVSLMGRHFGCSCQAPAPELRRPFQPDGPSTAELGRAASKFWAAHNSAGGAAAPGSHRPLAGQVRLRGLAIFTQAACACDMPAADSALSRDAVPPGRHFGPYLICLV